MDKETLLSKFKPGMGEPNATSQMYENIGISVRTLESYVDTILPGITDDASVTDDFIKLHTNFLKAMGGQMRHEKSEFIKNYKPSTVEPKKPEETITEDPELKALKEQFEELKNLWKGEHKKNSEEQIRNGLKEKSKALKVQNKALWDDVVSSTQIDEDMDSKSFEDAVKKVYEDKLKAYFGNGAAPYEGTGKSGGTTGSDSFKDVREAFKKRMQAKGKLPKPE